MMIPMISIDGLSGSVVRDGPGITQTQAMCLGMLVGQNKECGEAFEAAVEKFQQMMAEGLSGGSGIPGYSGISGYSGYSGESGISGDEAPRAVTTAVPHVVVEVPVVVKKAETPVVAEVPVAVAASVTTQQVATSATLPLEGTPEKSPKGNGVLVADEIVERTESASSDSPEPQVIDFRNVLIQPSQGGVDGVAMEKRVFTPAQVLVDAAAAVADTITVSPEVLRGASEVQVQLRPDVLEGTVIRIATTVPGTLTVQFTPVTENMAALLEKCAPQLVTYLSERIHNVQIAVNVKRDEKLKG